MVNILGDYVLIDTTPSVGATTIEAGLAKGEEREKMRKNN